MGYSVSDWQIRSQIITGHCFKNGMSTTLGCKHMPALQWTNLRVVGAGIGQARWTQLALPQTTRCDTIEGEAATACAGFAASGNFGMRSVLALKCAAMATLLVARCATKEPNPRVHPLSFDLPAWTHVLPLLPQYAAG
jgi:hypothetical protein